MRGARCLAGWFYAWLTRPRSRRSRREEELGAKVRASFLGSDRTYGARRVWHDLLRRRIARAASDRTIDAAGGPQSTSDGGVCRQIWVSGRPPPSLPMCSTAASKQPLPIANGLPTSPMSGPRRAGSMWPQSPISSPAVWLAGR